MASIIYKVGEWTYTDKDIINRGHLGNVYVARNETQNAIVKDVKRNSYSETELAVHQLLPPGPFPKLLAHNVDDRRIQLVLERAQYGNLYHFYKERPAWFSIEFNTRRLVRQMAECVSILHKAGVIHRDIKPEQFLVHNMTDNFPKIWLSDFDLASIVTGNVSLTQACGTALFAAPEIVRRQPYGYAVDVWSLGVSIYSLCAGYLPFDGEDSEEVFWNVMNKRQTYPRFFSRQLTDLLEGMLDKDPAYRLTIDQVIAHPWLKDPIIPPPPGFVQKTSSQ